MPQSFACVYAHLIFSTKNRERTIKGEWAPRLNEYLVGILRQRKCELLAAGGVEDHVHLLISMSREIAISDLVRDVKSISSHWIHTTIPGSRAFAWQQGYSVFSVSQSGLADVKDYIARQEEHHAKRSFKNELLMFLKKHGVEYDERYMWD
ncbi:transposase [Blastopirellula marina]|uniref:Transposase n=1 Tax=Blastopirellula marina TaxID=124 RepID=A0A2S8F5T1_9BACT|nr:MULTISPECIES: IS200/IS605 family transposase [Pirellulaceae]PQO27480.1 transposase [Blastopirellula marina]RCS48017.1 IS200/IS605 family transposase [Bremerella cremea]